MCSIRLPAGRGGSLSSGGLTLLFLAGVSVLGWVPAGCSSGGSRPPGPGQDAAMALDGSGAPADAASSGSDASGADLASTDLAGAHPDLSAPADLATPLDLAAPRDLAAPADLATNPDLAFATDEGVDIYVDNFCKMDVVPKVFNVPRGATLKLTFHNRSSDYAVTVWMSYGGGYTDLMTGGTWPDPIPHCHLGTRPYDEYADISTACSNYHLLLHCL